MRTRTRARVGDKHMARLHVIIYRQGPAHVNVQLQHTQIHNSGIPIGAQVCVLESVCVCVERLNCEYFTLTRRTEQRWFYISIAHLFACTVYLHI